MKILYRQNQDFSFMESISLLNIHNFFLKEITYEKDYKKTTRKMHEHTECEIHMIFGGKQDYMIDGVEYALGESQFLIIPPETKHQMVYASDNLKKYSITFNGVDFCNGKVKCGSIPAVISDSIFFIVEEYGEKRHFGRQLIEFRVAEMLILFCRMCGYNEENTDNETYTTENRLELADKFIADNIEQNLSVSDVAAYCHLSTRQIDRIFMSEKGVSPAEYIKEQKMTRIGECVKNTDLPLRKISEQFSYNNEYYFNAAFKKHFGVPPLTYRKMFRE